MEEHDDGKIHLPMTHSPEYGGSLRTRDANYDLALFRWGCQTLLKICKRLNIDDELKTRWQSVQDNLTGCPADDGVLRIGRDLKYERSHRHYSHLFSLFPLVLVDPFDPAQRESMIKSVDHWLSLKENLLGYTWTGASSMASILGEGDLSLVYLNQLKTFVAPNTMYQENGPVIETPISAAESMHNMLLQSWDDTIRVFPAAPAQWKNVSFCDLRAEGAFLVSAAKQDGVTRFVHVKSLAGEPCKVKTDIAGDICIHSDDTIEYNILDDGTIELKLEKGQSALLYSGQMPSTEIQPVQADSRYCHYFGMKQEDSEIQCVQQHTN